MHTVVVAQLEISALLAGEPAGKVEAESRAR